MGGIFDKIRRVFTREHPSSNPANSKCILAIDDDATQRAMIQKILTKKGYTVLIAEDGQKGLERALQQRPDLILLDVMMPGMPGNDVCRKLKANSQTKDIPVIFLTALDTPRNVIEHYDIGADIHLTKPVNSKELISQVEISLGLK